MDFVTRPNVNRMLIRGAAMAPVSSVVALLEKFGFFVFCVYRSLGPIHVHKKRYDKRHI